MRILDYQTDRDIAPTLSARSLALQLLIYGDTNFVEEAPIDIDVARPRVSRARAKHNKYVL